MTKKKILWFIGGIICIVFLAICLLGLRNYLQPFVRTAEFTVCDLDGKQHQISAELYFQRRLFSPTSVEGSVRVDDTRYATLFRVRNEKNGVVTPHFDENEYDFWFNLRAKWQEIQTSVILLAYDGGYTDRVYFSNELLFSGDPFEGEVEQIQLNGLAVNDDWEIVAVWLSGDPFTSAAFGPAVTIAENEKVKTEVFGILAPFVK